MSGQLGLAWAADLGTGRGLEATPIVVDGVLYTSGVAGRAYAYDAASGKQLWAFEPTVDMQLNRTACCDMVNRGVAVAKGKVFVVALDGWMYALDAKTGAVAWKTDAIEDRKRGDNSTGAPEVAGNVVVIGNAGAEYDTRGYVSAFDIDSGKLASALPCRPARSCQGAAGEQGARSSTQDLGLPRAVGTLAGSGAPWDAINYDPLTRLCTGRDGQWQALCDIEALAQGRRQSLSWLDRRA